MSIQKILSEPLWAKNAIQKCKTLFFVLKYMFWYRYFKYLGSTYYIDHISQDHWFYSTVDQIVTATHKQTHIY